jgi:nicotinate-nucleotide adenylyltransferase
VPKNAKDDALKRIGILGGTFDPIHVGHVAIARIAMATLSLDQLSIIPNRTPHKPAPHASDAQRLEMVQLACAPYPNGK